MSVGRNIKRLRFAAGIQTQKELAALLGVPQPQVSDWENDRYSVVETATLLKIAKGLRCSVDQLIAGLDPEYDRVREASAAGEVELGRVDFSVERPTEIPVVTEGDASPGGLTWTRGTKSQTQVKLWVSRPGDLLDPKAYGVRVSSDSMVPVHRPPMIAIVSPARRVENGDEVYVQLASGECLIKRAHKTTTGYVLESYNHTYPARVVKDGEVVGMDVIVYSRRRDL